MTPDSTPALLWFTSKFDPATRTASFFHESRSKAVGRTNMRVARCTLGSVDDFAVNRIAIIGDAKALAAAGAVLSLAVNDRPLLEIDAALITSQKDHLILPNPILLYRLDMIRVVITAEVHTLIPPTDFTLHLLGQAIENPPNQLDSDWILKLLHENP